MISSLSDLASLLRRKIGFRQRSGKNLQMGAAQMAAGLYVLMASKTHRKETSPSGIRVLEAEGSRSSRVSCFCALIWGAISRGAPL
jgi:hypothetical protein